MINISTGIVTYNPDINRLKENISSVIVQCDHVYLVDNGSTNFNEIDALVKEFNYEKVVIIRNNSNLGIAAALNQMCKQAKEDGCLWLVTLDQDSVSPSNLVNEYKKHIGKQEVAMLCPIIYDRNKKASIGTYDSETIEVKECITSGAMINLNVWQELKGFDEVMFIDGVDFDICHRITKHGYKILCVTSVVLVHELGHIEIRKFLFWKVVVKNHSAFRKYYIARNIIYLARKEHTSIVKALLQNVKLIIIVVLYERDKKDKIGSIFRGVYHGFKEKVGG